VESLLDAGIKRYGLAGHLPFGFRSLTAPFLHGAPPMG